MHKTNVPARPKPWSRLTPAECERIVRLYEDDYLAPFEIAPMVGRSRESVRQVLIRAGVYAQTRIRVSSETRRQAVALYESGVTLANIRGHLGISKNAVYTALRLHNIPLRRPATVGAQTDGER